jgi:hypothetical protein
MVALPTDVRRSSSVVKSAFETVFLAMVALLEKSASGQRRVKREKAQAIAALCIGGLIVSRALRDGNVADELREACMAVALGLAGPDESPPARAANGQKMMRGRGRVNAAAA